ncbi:hypothetical protein QUA04_28915, partial [Microcoleus sp. S13_C5]
FWHSLFDGGGVPPDYIMVDRPDMISDIESYLVSRDEFLAAGDRRLMMSFWLMACGEKNE